MSAKLSIGKEKPESHDLRSIVAWNVRRHRISNKLSQEQLAFEAGLDRTYVSALERRVWNVALSNIEKLAHALRIPAWQLLYVPSELNDESKKETTSTKL
jgi:transcriptional regulator with XRE-family HTH domain